MTKTQGKLWEAKKALPLTGHQDHSASKKTALLLLVEFYRARVSLLFGFCDTELAFIIRVAGSQINT